ncbi:MAG: hypothetical protein ACMUHM_04225 [Thermoplasmatota archaeon]
MDYFQREKKKETIFDRLDMTQAVVSIFILVNAAFYGLMAIYFLDGHGMDFDYNEIFKEAQQTISIPKADSDTRLIIDEYFEWPDKLSDVEEIYIYGTDWRDPDTDNDGMEDGWEVHHSICRDWIYPITSPDPRNWDPYGNFDGDGFDADRDGFIDKEEALFNLREYCGGALFDLEAGTFDPSEPIFGGLDPAVDWQEIGMKGGYHLYDCPDDGIVGNPENMDNSNFDDYLSYDPEDPDNFPPVTTSPSSSDTDGDGMDDGWEVHYGRLLKEMEDPVHEPLVRIPIVINEKQDERRIDPLWSGDAGLDIDSREIISITAGQRKVVNVYSKDGLTNLEEFEAGTNPLLWDSDGDSFFNALKGVLFQLDDGTEVRMEYLNFSSWNWNWDCPYPFNDYRLDPMNPDTDGDQMMDGWELATGLNPLNGTDAFKDLDGDGLPNYLEYGFPNRDDIWFITDPKNPDTDGDGMLDGWEAYNSKIISRIPAMSARDDLEDKIADGKRTIFTVSPMIQDAEEDNDGYWATDEFGSEIYTRISDGVTNLEEYYGSKYYPRSSDPSDADSDDDGLYDGEEMKYGFPGELIGGRYVTDPDIAARYHTNHNAPDTDMDRWGLSYDGPRILTDWEEVHGRTRDVQPRNGFDDDGDGEVDEYEGEYLFFPSTNASNPDSDLDGLMDVDEVFGIDTRYFWQWSELGVIRTDPTMTDSDGDGLNDLFELEPMPYLRQYNTDPLDPDTDRDGMTDWHEWTTDFFPLVNWDRTDDPEFLDPGHSRSDCVNEWGGNYDIYFVDRTDPNDPDTDGDGMPDGWEFRNGYLTYTKENYTLIEDHLDKDKWIYTYCIDVMPYSAPGTKFWVVNPLLSDGFDDPDRDGLTNFEEYQHKTHPLKVDTDGDGMPDGWELDPENRGQPAYDPWSRRYRWTLDPLNPNDWYLDPDHDGVILYHWTPSTYLHGRYYNETFYFPWVNLYEYMFGKDLDGDGINEVTTGCAPRIAAQHNIGGYDSDSDGTPDGYEVFWDDEDNDTLPTGWELFYNGTLWNSPETLPYKDPGLDWNPFTTSLNSRGPFLEIANVILTKGKLFHDRSDSNIDGVRDDLEDWDDDLHLNGAEWEFRTDPTDDRSYPYSPALLMSDSRRSRAG